MNEIVPIRRALCQRLRQDGIDRARPRTRRRLDRAAGERRHARRPGRRGLQVTEVADYTGQPEILGGRVKTSIPRFTLESWHAATSPETWRRWRQQGFAPIDLVVVNLYPFEATIARPDATFARCRRKYRRRRPHLVPRGCQEPRARRRALEPRPVCRA